ncbi:MlaC/ttg2D family ABC transporter substrate-binding protein [Ampullimonas aquatilis]|uniref:MlaC/ttg2D family ABC transporter substrate-binding protein n=1 Tax=Ampullimonas aquatilis TaxID=1341549 RepID=UPI003C72DE6A
MIKQLFQSAILAGFVALSSSAFAIDTTKPDIMIKELSDDLINTVKADKAIQGGDQKRVFELVDTKVMPYVNFQRMTALTVGRYWKQATPEQQGQLQKEFKTLLVRTYSGAVSQIKDQQVQLKPFRAEPTDTEVVVQTKVLQKGDPIQLDYRMEKNGDNWKIFDVNVLGVWLVETYKDSFRQEIGKTGIDGLIKSLVEKNQANEAKTASAK